VVREAHIDRLKQSDDFIHEQLNNGIFPIEVMYYFSLCDQSMIKQEIAHPYLLSLSPEAFEQVLHAALTCQDLPPDVDLAPSLLDKSVIIKLQGKYYSIKAAKQTNDQPSDAVTETTLQGPQSAFSESAETNLNIIRKRYPTADLVAEKCKLGRVTQTTSFLIYDAERTDPGLLKDLKRRIRDIDADVVQSAGQMEALLSKRKYSWLPTMLVTERPDRVVLNLSQGKIILMLDGNPFVLILPAVFFDFISAMDDIYQTYFVTRAFLLLRYISILITVTLPSLYIAIVSYNPEILKVQLALSIAGSRAAVPFPSFLEVLFMLFMIEALIEASLRLPRYIGATATTVGGLILGQAAQMAGLVSSIMIIVTSVVAIANFLIPINAMSFGIRLAKYPMILLASCFGLVGVISGMFAFALFVVNKRSFGRPYFQLFLGEQNASGYKHRKAGAAD